MQDEAIVEEKPNTEPHNLCRFCGSSLAAPGARKCVHCSEYQSWWRQVLSRIGLSDLALLVAVGSLAWVAIQDVVRGEKAALDLKVLECASSHIGLAVFNAGSQPGILSRLKVAVVDANAANAAKPKASFPLSIDIQGKQTGAIQVDPGKHVLLNYQVTGDMKNEFTESCKLRIVADKYEESEP
jgi:hypothetical protein